MKPSIRVSSNGHNRVTLEIPQGMSGNQLEKWMKANPRKLRAAKLAEAGTVAIIAVAESEDSDSVTGDSRGPC